MAAHRVWGRGARRRTASDPGRSRRAGPRAAARAEGSWGPWAAATHGMASEDQ